MQAKLEIDVRANPHSKNLVVEEANRLGARYVVIDRLDGSSLHCLSSNLPILWISFGLVSAFFLPYCDSGLECAGI